MTNYPEWRKKRCPQCAAGVPMSADPGYHWNGAVTGIKCTAPSPDALIAELEAQTADAEEEASRAKDVCAEEWEKDCAKQLRKLADLTKFEHDEDGDPADVIGEHVEQTIRNQQQRIAELEQRCADLEAGAMPRRQRIAELEAQLSALKRESACPCCKNGVNIEGEPCQECHGKALAIVAYETTRSQWKRQRERIAELEAQLKAEKALAERARKDALQAIEDKAHQALRDGQKMFMLAGERDTAREAGALWALAYISDTTPHNEPDPPCVEPCVACNIELLMRRIERREVEVGK